MEIEVRSSFIVGKEHEKFIKILVSVLHLDRILLTLYQFTVSQAHMYTFSELQHSWESLEEYYRYSISLFIWNLNTALACST